MVFVHRKLQKHHKWLFFPAIICKLKSNTRAPVVFKAKYKAEFIYILKETQGKRATGERGCQNSFTEELLKLSQREKAISTAYRRVRKALWA